jgi:hypothetical protein
VCGFEFGFLTVDFRDIAERADQKNGDDSNYRNNGFPGVSPTQLG